jgi:hypothetical protein
MKKSIDSQITKVVKTNPALFTDVKWSDIAEHLLHNIRLLEAEIEKKDNQIQSLVDLFYNKN